MFDIGTALAAGTMLIGGYGSGGITIAGAVHEGALLVQGMTVSRLGWHSAKDITEAALVSVVAPLEACPEILLIGTGKGHEFVPPSIRQFLKREYGIAMDSMDTGAACRTYNILASEGRSVAAILLPL